MADTKLSDLTAATSVADTDFVYGGVGGNSRKVPVSLFEVGLGAVASVTALKGLTGAYDGQVARVVSNRQFGHFKWAAGDLSALVAADPYGGIYVAPTAAPTGAIGAWVRQVEKDTWDAEWWLPEAMPADGQTYINSAILAIPGNAGRFLFPRRQVNLTGSVRLMKGLSYDGFGQEAALDGNGGNFFGVIIGASNSRLHNIAAGNVAGQLTYGEAGGFHVYDGADYWNADIDALKSIENVSAKDCYTFNAECGFRAGMSAYVEGGGSPGSEPKVVTLFASRDVYLENFRADDIKRIGIECMRANGVEIVGGKVVMGVPDTIVGFDRGVRLDAPHNVHISGLHVVAPNTTTVRGISVEPASQGGEPYTYGGATNITVEGVTVEDCTAGMTVTGGFCRNISFRNNKIVGRRETYNNPAFILEGDARSNGFTLDQTPHLGIRVEGNEAINVGYFLVADGHIHDVDISGNTFISNTATGTAAQSFIYSSSATEKKLIGWRVTGNVSYTPGTANQNAIRMLLLHADTDITFDDNSLTPDTNGVFINLSGDATVRTRNQFSNRRLPASAWAVVRPPLDKNDYPAGDAGITR